jgi:prophage maintenance system killer protein
MYSIKIETVKEIFDFLHKSTKNFVEKPDSLEQVHKCIERQLENYDGKFANNETIFGIIYENIREGHYLINGNKRLA